MKKNLRQFLSIWTFLVLLVASVLPVVKAYATPEEPNTNEPENYELTIDIGSNADWATGVTVDGVNWSSEGTYLSTTGQYFITAELHVPDDQVRENTSIRAGGNTAGVYAIHQAGETEHLEGETKFTFIINYDTTIKIDHLSLNPYSEGENGNPDPYEPHGNTEATIILRGGSGSYQEDIHDENNQIVETRTIYYTDTYREANVAINSEHYAMAAPEDEDESGEFSQISYFYDSEESDDTVTIRLSALWHLKFVDQVIINNHPYEVSEFINYSDQKSYLDHYSGQMVSFTIGGVEKANTYDITVKIGRNEQDFIGNFLWTADPAQEFERDEKGDIIYDENGNPVPGRDYIGHSSLELMAVSYTVGNTTYSCSAIEGTCSWWEVGDEENVTSCDVADENCTIPYLEFDSGNSGYDDGSLVIPAGAKVTIRVIPDYGYQVLNVNMSELTTSETGIGEFTFTVPEGAAYFVADVVEMQDTVKADTDLVANGAINLGNNQTTLNYGTARLEVGDVNLSDEAKAAFQDAAGDYDIKNYLDISLYNVVCRGAATCTGTDEDSWNKRIHDLNEAATITLQLEDGVDGNDIVIVHEKSPGVYEIIPTTYDPETNTITFTTTSFSNYAIAARTVELSPDTGYSTSQTNSVASPIVGTALVVTFSLGGIILKRKYIK